VNGTKSKNFNLAHACLATKGVLTKYQVGEQNNYTNNCVGGSS
jgi:hypothetical protein